MTELARKLNDRDGYTEQTGVIAAIVHRDQVDANTAHLASGRLSLWAISLRKGQVLTGAAFLSGTQAAVNPSNQWFALYSSASALVRQTTDDTTTAWAASTTKQLAFTSSYTVTASGLFYLGMCVVADTTPSHWGKAVTLNAMAATPKLGGTSSTGLTSTAPATAAGITHASSLPRGWVY